MLDSISFDVKDIVFTVIWGHCRKNPISKTNLWMCSRINPNLTSFSGKPRFRSKKSERIQAIESWKDLIIPIEFQTSQKDIGLFIWSRHNNNDAHRKKTDTG